MAMGRNFGKDLFFPHSTFHLKSIYIQSNTHPDRLSKIHAFEGVFCEHIFVGLLYLNQINMCGDPFCSLLLLIKVWLKFLFRCKGDIEGSWYSVFYSLWKMCRIRCSFNGYSICITTSNLWVFSAKTWI